MTGQLKIIRNDLVKRDALVKYLPEMILWNVETALVLTFRSSVLIRV